MLGKATHALGSVLCEMEIWLIWSSQAARQGTTVSLFCLTVLYSPSCPNTSFMHRSERPCGHRSVTTRAAFSISAFTLKNLLRHC